MMTLRLYQRLYFASLFRLNFFYMYRYLFFLHGASVENDAVEINYE